MGRALNTKMDDYIPFYRHCNPAVYPPPQQPLCLWQQPSFEGQTHYQQSFQGQQLNLEGSTEQNLYTAQHQQSFHHIKSEPILHPQPSFQEAYNCSFGSNQNQQQENMAGPQQYNYAPPPPPPSSNFQQQQHPQYGYGQLPHNQQAGRGGARGGRGGHRGDYHASGPYNQQVQGGYNGMQRAQGPPQIQNQGPPGGYNGSNGHQPYIGPQAPGPHGPTNSYAAPQWQNPQHGPTQHGPQHMPGPMQPPAPLVPQNYHPNYAPQSFNQHTNFGPQQPHTFQTSQSPSYGHSMPPNQQAPPHWSGPPQHAQPPFGGRGRGGRGGFNQGRGGHDAPLMGPPIRMGFDNDRADHMAQASNGFPPPYANSHQSPPIPPYSQPTYQGYPPPQNFPQRPPLDPHPFSSGSHKGGRGGHSNNFRGRNSGGGGGGGGDRGDRGDRGNFSIRGRDSNNRHHNGNQRSTSENFHLKSAGAEQGGKKKKKRRTNTLGLTPAGADREESEEEIDDVDEEARLVTLLGPDTPQLPADLEIWLAERKSRFPTKARREAAEEELRKRREQKNGNKTKQHDKPIKKDDAVSKLEKQQRKAEKLRLELEKAEKKIQDAISGSKRKRETGDEGDDDRGQVSGEDSDDSSGSDSDASKPEALSSRSSAPLRVHQAPKAQLQRHCKYFSTGGTCGKKGKCRFVHDQEVRSQALRDKEANGGKMTLAQRLILNDTAKDDLTILKSIKYLKEKGLMPEQAAGSEGKVEDDDAPVRIKSEETGYTENLEYGDS